MAPSGKTENTPEHHAEAILRAAGSSLSNYTLNGTREAILAAVREAMGDGWRSMDTAPTSGEFVLLHAPNMEPTVSLGWWDDAFDRWGYLEGDLCISRARPVGWQPLPIPPAPGGKA